jgi:hypothetical protein
MYDNDGIQNKKLFHFIYIAVVMKQEPLALAAMRGLSVTVGPVCIFR